MSLLRVVLAPRAGPANVLFLELTGGIEAALEQASAAAGDLDVKIGGGVETVRQYLRAALVDELHFALSPVVLGEGEAMFAARCGPLCFGCEAPFPVGAQQV